MTSSHTDREPAERRASPGDFRARPGLCWGLVGLLAVVIGGCASYTGTVEDAKAEVVEGNTRGAVKNLNDAIKVDENYQVPKKLSGKNTLILLERATLLQALGEYKLAARDMMIADQQLDWLDIGAQGKAKIGKYMYSGTSVRYRAPPYERLLLNTLNMINFLALRDWEGAKVEARRFSLLEHFFVEKEEKTILPGAVAFGNYLGGVAFEAAGDYREAARYYVGAWHHGIRANRLRKRLVALCSMIGYKPSELIDVGKGGLSSLDSAVAGAKAPSFEKYRRRFVDGELIAIVQTGLVPYKRAKRYPLVQALRYTEGRAAYGTVALTATERRRARELAVSGALKWVNFPALSEAGLPPTREVSVKIDGSRAAPEIGVNVEKQVEHAWNRMSGALMAAAISRMIVRAVAGAATREAVQASGQGGESQALGVLAQVAVEGGMAAADRPDTRSWSLLPSRIRFRRREVSPGNHEVRVSVNGSSDSKSVEVPEKGPTIVNFSQLR